VKQQIHIHLALQLNDLQKFHFHTFQLIRAFPGVPLYLAMGYHTQERIDQLMPDGVVLPIVRMTKDL
jgi:hypothetical protein